MNADDLVLLGRAPGLERPLSRGELLWLFDLVREESLLDTLFYDGSTRRAGEFADLMQEAGTWLYVVCGGTPGPLRGRAPLAFCWLNNFSGRGAMIHFCVLGKGRERAAGIGRFVVRALLLAGPGRAAEREILTADGPWAAHRLAEATAEPGPYCLDALFGLTPAPFRHALDFIHRLGFQEKGRLPHALSIRRGNRERCVPGVLTCLTREDLLEAALRACP